ncbi:hypothetical protein D3C86_2024200 [compost metagenome]
MLVTLLTPVFGPRTFIYAAMVVAALYALFVLVRLSKRDEVPAGERETFELKSAQVPNAGALIDAEARAE